MQATDNKGTTGCQLDDATLLSRLTVLVTRDRTTTAKLLWHLAEVDVRGLYRDEGYSSLFEYCVKSLHMSEGEASLRIRAARLSRRFPVVLAKVERGELHLSALRELAPVLTVDNHRQLLAAATHKTIMGKAMTLLVEQLKKQRFGHTNRPRGSAARAKKPSKPESKPEPNIKAGETACREPKTKVTDAAPKPGSRNIPAEVRRKVVERDGARCTFVSDSGRRCEATDWLEFHHADPFARGGAATVENVRLMCRSHNALMAERDFGRQFILQKRHVKRVNHRTFPDPSSG